MWDSGLTEKNIEDLEKTQKSFVRLITNEKYFYYNTALHSLGLVTLSERRKYLTSRFAETSIADGILSDLFPLRKNHHKMKTCHSEYFKVIHANKKVYQQSPIITMQKLMNERKKSLAVTR